MQPDAGRTPAGMLETPSLREVGRRVEEILARMRAAAEPGVAEGSEELVRLLVELYGSALERVLAVLAAAPGTDDQIGRLVSDPLLAGLFVLHDLHPVPTEERIRRAVAAARPTLGLGPDDAVFLRLDDDGVAHLRFVAGGPSPGPATGSVRRSIEQAIAEAAPEVTAVQVEEAVPVRIGPKPARARRCGLCHEPIPADHRHVVELEPRHLICACRPCHLLFARKGAAGGRYLAVPDRYLSDPDFRLADRQWDELQIPVRTAFFFHHSGFGRPVAFYPSPAGATESLLPLDAWEQLAAQSPLFSALAPDVEAILVHDGGGGLECHLTPIDACYELVGLVRSRWRGFDGGEDVRIAVAGFLERLRRRARPLTPGVADR